MYRNRPHSLDGPLGSVLSTDLRKLSKPNNTSHCRSRMTSTFLEIIPKGNTRRKESGDVPRPLILSTWHRPLLPLPETSWGRKWWHHPGFVSPLLLWVTRIAGIVLHEISEETIHSPCRGLASCWVANHSWTARLPSSVRFPPWSVTQGPYKQYLMTFINIIL